MIMEPNESQLEEGLEKLQASQQQLLDLAKEMITVADLYQMDLLTTAVLNRSLALIEGERTQHTCSPTPRPPAFR
jgi:hypothetical protein